MPGGLVPRMAIEWGFLILVAVGAAVADLSAGVIILVMAIGWILVVLVELVAWRARPSYAVTETVEAPPTESGPARAAGQVPPLQPSVPPAYDFEFERPGPKLREEVDEVSVEDTAVVAVPARAEEEADRPPVDPDDPYAPAPERERLQQADQRVVHRLEPLKPRPKRRWFGR